ncbi:MAG: hypothetical protein Q4F66_11760, partial [Clostridium sp.]|nr:hypothetical protein [Clostridium sp.]
REEKKNKSRKKKVVRERSLEAYMQKECFDEYIQRYLLDIFLTEDFHKLDVIKAKLIEAGIKDAQREKLIDFINIIARSGVEGAVGYRNKKNKKKGNYSRYTMKKYEQILRELGIHIISLPIKTKGVGNILENPLGKWKVNNV